MKFNDIIELWKNEIEIVGFRRNGYHYPWDGVHNYITFNKDNDLVRKNITQREEGFPFAINYNDLMAEDWYPMYQKKDYHYDMDGKLIKPCKMEYWVNIYSCNNEEIPKTFYCKEDADANIETFKYNNKSLKQKTIFVKQLHIAQQYSVPYFTEEDYAK